MRRHSLAGPLLLVLIGGLFLWRNLHPETRVFDLVAEYWPFLLIGWGLIRLVEVLLSEQQRHFGLTGGEVVLVVLISFAGLGLFEAHRHGFRITPEIFGEQYEYPVTATAPLGTAKRIVFENPRGNIRVTGADTKDVAITGHQLIRAESRGDADATHGRAPLEIVPQGDALVVRTNQDHAPESQRISDDLDVTAPRGVSIEARGQNGDYEISETAGDVDLSNGRGDVRLSRIGGSARLEIGRSDVIRAVDIKGSVQLDGRGSDIEMENIAGQVTIHGAYVGTLDFKNLAKPLEFEGARNTELRVAAVPGSINMDLGGFTARNITGPVRLVTQSRDIRLEDFTQSLELETERGDIELQPARVPLPRIEVRSGVGRIDLVLPEKAAFQLQATAERGQATNDFGPAIQKEVFGRTSTLKGTVGSGPLIRITADRGSVSVRKEGNAPSESDAVPATPQPPKAPKDPASTLQDSEVKL
jgi:putative adhesin/cell wall-active antibiotic response 4TMS protein YvqF